jgi:hypothetical protein
MRKLFADVLVTKHMVLIDFWSGVLVTTSWSPMVSMLSLMLQVVLTRNSSFDTGAHMKRIVYMIERRSIP